MKGSSRFSRDGQGVLCAFRIMRVFWVPALLCMALAMSLWEARAGAQPAERRGPVKEDALRKELEAAYTTLFNALKKKDFDAAVPTIFAPPGALDEGSRDEFAEMADDLLEMMPELSKTKFVAVKTQGEDLAGYYCVFEGGGFWNVVLHTFMKRDGRWKWVPGGDSSSFQPKPGEDILAKAKQLVETSEVLRLKPPELAGPGTVPRGAEPRAVLSCMAYDYEVKIAINGAPFKFSGGKSFSGMLFEAPPGAQPAEPAVLRMGENQITVEYRKTNGKGTSRLSVEIMALQDRPSFNLVTAAKPQGKVSAKFHVPANPKDAVRLVEIDDDKR